MRRLFKKYTTIVNGERSTLINLVNYRVFIEISFKKLAIVELTKENFAGHTSLLRALHAQIFESVSDLPNELVLLGKYPNVGEIGLANLFKQLKTKNLTFSKIEFP